jgi:hypothetical protein
MRDHNDEGALAPLGDHDSPQENEDEEENSAKGEQASWLCRLGRLCGLRERDELPVLNPGPALIQSPSSWTSINKEEFKLRLERFLKDADPNIPEPSFELVDFLFNTAVDAHWEIAAWKTTIEKVKDREFDRTRSYLRRELRRYGSLLRRKREEGPTWMSSWAECWVGAFEEIQGEIEAGLRSAGAHLDSLSRLRTSGRIHIESHILSLKKKFIHTQIANTPFKRKLNLILAAFAYAAAVSKYLQAAHIHREHQRRGPVPID